VKRFVAIIAAMSLAAAAYCADGSALKFRVYYLIKGEKVKKSPVLSHGEAGVKTFPLRVREFLQPSKYYDFKDPYFKKRAAALFLDMSPKDRKNSAAISGFVMDFVSVSVTAASDSAPPSLDPHEIYRPASAVLRDMSGNTIEKYRLITALLRYAGVPARVSYWNDSYVAEYYSMPADMHKGSTSWQPLDLSGAYGVSGGRVIPISWNPVDNRERLNEEWNTDTISVRALAVSNIYSDMNEAEALASFTSVESGSEVDASSDTELAAFYLFKTVDYEVIPPEGVEKFQVEFTMPFNEVEPFKTMKYFVKPLSPGLAVKMGRSHTYIKPLVKGMIYSLPVTFGVKKRD
jgi:hypothetical protein